MAFRINRENVTICLVNLFIIWQKQKKCKLGVSLRKYLRS